MRDFFFDVNGNLTKDGKKFLIKFGFIMLFSLPIMYFKYLFCRRY